MNDLYELTTEQKFEMIKRDRDVLLGNTDWIITACVEKGKQVPNEWVIYRQALRDIPETYATPEEVIFPVKPQDVNVDSLPNAISSSGYKYEMLLLAPNLATTTDGATIHFGNSGAVGTAVQTGQSIGVAGRIVGCTLNWFAATAGTAENINFSLRVNDTTDYLVQTVGNNLGVKVFTNTSLDIPVVVGDKICGKLVFPTWATNPANVRITARVVIAVE